MFLKLTIYNSKKPVLVAVDNISTIQSADEGALVGTKYGSSIQVRQAVHQIEAMLKNAGIKCIAG